MVRGRYLPPMRYLLPYAFAALGVVLVFIAILLDVRPAGRRYGELLLLTLVVLSVVSFGAGIYLLSV